MANTTVAGQQAKDADNKEEESPDEIAADAMMTVATIGTVKDISMGQLLLEEADKIWIPKWPVGSTKCDIEQWDFAQCLIMDKEHSK